MGVLVSLIQVYNDKRKDNKPRRNNDEDEEDTTL